MFWERSVNCLGLIAGVSLASPPPSASYFSHSLLVSFPLRKFLETPARQVRSLVACVAADFFSFPGGDRGSERKSGRAKEHAWGEQKFGEKWGGGDVYMPIHVIC